ncbi:hypothetical protein L211DRAFT_878601 [Terfezia boudieri ATCC MYA-4762]|uniref:Uncharacterized protein n=1 Tax=Terfezia boudieri ATCC MYA-4762 TaxID=1051890 RepID=A0A3N4LN33_9PEZI|nr:hypothetical protein L211DRAFT_878601 [Terfezia boudieri ATCC MYA-4762]
MMVNISAIKIPHYTEKARIQQHLDDLESTAIEEILKDEPNSGLSADYYYDLLEDISKASKSINIKRYLIDRSKGTAGCHKSDDILEDIIKRYSEEAFLVYFWIHQASFWLLIEKLHEATKELGFEDYWHECRRENGSSNRPMPIYKQVAVALYKLGSRTGSLECDRIALNIGKMQKRMC